MNINEINQIKTDTQGNFIKLVNAYIEYGIVKFQTCASTAKTMYFDSQGNNVYDEQDFFNFTIGILDADKFKADLLDHQQGKTDFKAWLELTANSGIAYWIVDLKAGTCIYYDLKDNPVHTELIPGL